MNGVGVRVDVNEELKFLEEFKKKIFFFLGGGGSRERGRVVVGGVGNGAGVRMDVRWGVRLVGGGGQGGCE